MLPPAPGEVQEARAAEAGSTVEDQGDETCTVQATPDDEEEPDSAKVIRSQEREIPCRIVTSDPSVKVILFNIFGGIVRCDDIAEGIVQAVREIDLSVPVIVRLEGTNVDQGKALLAGSGLDITAADDLTDAACKAVAAV